MHMNGMCPPPLRLALLSQGEVCLVWVDNKVIDGAVNGVAASLGGLSARARRIQTGYTRSYSLVMLSGALLVLVFLAIVGR